MGRLSGAAQTCPNTVELEMLVADLIHPTIKEPVWDIGEKRRVDCRTTKFVRLELLIFTVTECQTCT